MSLEQAIDKLTAAIEAATGVLVTLGAANKAAAGTPAPTPAAPPAASKGAAGKGKAASTPAPPPAADEGLGGDDGGLGGDDGGLGGDDELPAGVTPEEAKAAVLAYRDKAIKLKGKDDGLNLTRTAMKKFVAALDEINDENAAEIHKAFTAAVAKLK